jgi:molybdate/tungstate transport system substrate-binding protein
VQFTEGIPMKKTVLCSLVVGSVLLASSSAYADDSVVNVMYAGSLVHLMERSVGPAFKKTSGIDFSGYAGGSNKLANEIKGKLRRADVFISASPKVNSSLMGAENGAWVQWYVNFAESPLLIGYNAHSKFASALQSKRWDQVLSQPGIHIGRTDPKLDPKGAFTVDMVKRAAVLYKQPDLLARTLGTPDNPQQVLPEEALVGRLQSGQLDAGFFYSTETTDLNIPAIKLPHELAAKASYTITILRDAAHPRAADQFVTFLLSEQGRALLKQHGIDVIKPVVTGGTPTAAVSQAISKVK